ncbi:hypothetical protein H257_07516 [Aphanomyces astaci]|uniref:Uncharacterized protein n=1 Tax=Aphanomyces astaci TaxID=112090 RepID=W4GIN0_APHAT|nr:hypothetical protein H257_07516 [Aphanomyces astaci]ETV79532.1 hypothetical protein H257_07516 [Aphanomyces astaci]|eukprot:XP_009831373.1 hypothetical protein H257_07516 [Aphanomyces astaci]
MAANSKDPNIQLLVFNGNKKGIRVWTQKFVQHLKALTTAKVGLCKVLPDAFTQQFKDPCGEDQSVHLLWAAVEKRYGESNANTVKTLVGHLISTANNDFPNMEVLFCDLKSARNTINVHTQKYLGRDMISEDLIVALVLGVLPNEYFGAQISLDEKGFNLVDVKAKLIGIFGTKSKKVVMGMGSQSNNIYHGYGQSKGNHAVNFVQSGDKKRKHGNGPTVGNDVSVRGQCFYCIGQCFYCIGQYNVGGQPHVKSECPKRKEDFERKEFRSNITQKPNSKRPKVGGTKIPCGIVEYGTGQPTPALNGPNEDHWVQEYVVEDRNDFLDLGSAGDIAVNNILTVDGMSSSMKQLSVQLDQKWLRSPPNRQCSLV